MSGVAVSAVAFAALQSPAVSAPTSADPDTASSTSRSDNLPNPLAEKQAALRAEAVKKLATGEAKLTTRGGDRVIALKGGKDASGKQKADRYVSYPVEREEAIFTVLTDFGDQTKAGQSTKPGGDASPCIAMVKFTATGFIYDQAVTRPTTGDYPFNCDPENVKTVDSYQQS